MWNRTTPAPARQGTGCPPWCNRTHPDGFPVGYCESRPLATLEKTPGHVRTVTAIRFVPAVADRVPEAEMVAVKGGARPVLFTLDEAEQLSIAFSALVRARRMEAAS